MCLLLELYILHYMFTFRAYEKLSMQRGDILPRAGRALQHPSKP